VARAALFPTVSLTGALGAQSAELSNLLASGAGIWSLGFGLTLPIFDAGRREARVEQADARREQALANYQRSIETAFREVSDALVNVGESTGTEADLAARLQAARSALELSTLRYESGYSPYLEVLDAQRTANEAELAFVRNRQARLAFSVDLMKALGGGWKQNSGSGS
jgi:multidrug efflux system outer membrane protein